MNRREALSSVGLILGGTIIGSQAFLSGCNSSENELAGFPLSESHLNLLNEIGEAILPKTEKTPGAKEVNIGSFMDSIVSDFYSPQEQMTFVRGIRSLEMLCDERFDHGFTELSNEQRVEVLLLLEKEAGEYLEKSEPHYYIMIKQLTIWGYLSSEAVAFQGFNHMVLTPKFVGCVPYSQGDKALFADANEWQAYGYATHHMKTKS